ncbi:cytochrome c5 family protein, partial [Pseudomonas sp. KHB2.9]
MTRWLLAVGVLMPLYGAQATQEPEAVYNRVCVACHAG